MVEQVHGFHAQPQFQPFRDQKSLLQTEIDLGETGTADEVYVASGGSLNHALWGGLMSTRAVALGAAGVVLDGFTRDTREILQLGFPVFCRGSYTQDVSFRGRIAAFRVEIRIGQATIRPGDILFGDIDGVLVIPREIEAETVTRALRKSGAKSSCEKRYRRE